MENNPQILNALNSSSELFYKIVPATLVLYYREWIDLNRAAANQLAQQKSTSIYIEWLLGMEPVFARRWVLRHSHHAGTAIKVRALVARYVAARESGADWRC